jgi:hypothetical protein
MIRSCSSSGGAGHPATLFLERRNVRTDPDIAPTLQSDFFSIFLQRAAIWSLSGFARQGSMARNQVRMKVSVGMPDGKRAAPSAALVANVFDLVGKLAAVNAVAV